MDAYLCLAVLLTGHRNSRGRVLGAQRDAEVWDLTDTFYLTGELPWLLSGKLQEQKKGRLIWFRHM